MLQNTALLLVTLNFVIVPVIIAAVVLKVVLFVKFKTADCNYYNLIYFKTRQILSSKTEVNVNIKIIQNSLSGYVVFLALLNLLASMYATS